MADDEADDTTPVPELERLAWEAEPGLAAAVRRSIQRRLFAGRAVELGWTAPAAVLMEFVRLVFRWLSLKKTEREDDDA